MSAANMLLYLNPETVTYVFFRHHTQFHERNFSSSKSLGLNTIPIPTLISLFTWSENVSS